MGAATARLFAAEGAHVTVADVQVDVGQQLVQEIASAGGKAAFHRCDVSAESDVRDSLQQAAEHFGPPQNIVNSAGIVAVKQLHECTEADWDALMGVNLKSVFFSLKHGLPFLRSHRRSYMVNIGSVGSFTGQALTPVYNTSKAAVLQLSRAIALDYAEVGLRCNCVCPGITDTPMLRYHLSKTADPEAVLNARLKRVPIGIVLTPEDIARSILFLSCEDSAGVTATSLVVDGGYLAAAEWESSDQTAFRDPL